ncbi:MAG: hypothetical protein RLZ56_1445 [Bacteroidota bacterium]
MSMRKLLMLIIFCICAGLKSYAQQEPIYGQYMFNTLAINPAYAGSHDMIGATMLYRNQWIGVPGAPKTTMAGIDIPDNVNGLGYGFQIVNDQIGVQNTTGLTGAVSYRTHLLNENDELSTGIQFAFANYQANFASIALIQNFDPSFTGITINKWLPNAGVGMYYHNEKFFLGISAPVLLNSQVGLRKTDFQNSAASVFSTPHYFLNTGYVMNIDEDFAMKPSLLLKAVSGAPINWDLNTNIYYRDALSIGASYRSNAALVAMFQIRLNEQWQFGYAYEKTLSNIKYYSTNTHEFMFRYEMKPIKSILHPRTAGHSIYF